MTGIDRSVRCGPCHAIAPTYEALSKQYTSVNFLKCDVEAARDVASQYAVRAMYAFYFIALELFMLTFTVRPTFVFLKGATKVDQVQGADRAYVWTRYFVFLSDKRLQRT